MNLEIKLEDENTCKGCPLDSTYHTVCKGGFERLDGKINQAIDPYNRGPYINVTVLRPQACKLADKIDFAIKSILLLENKNEPIVGTTVGEALPPQNPSQGS